MLSKIMKLAEKAGTVFVSLSLQMSIVLRNFKNNLGSH